MRLVSAPHQIRLVSHDAFLSKSPLLVYHLWPPAMFPRLKRKNSAPVLRRLNWPLHCPSSSRRLPATAERYF